MKCLIDTNSFFGDIGIPHTALTLRQKSQPVVMSLPLHIFAYSEFGNLKLSIVR